MMKLKAKHKTSRRLVSAALGSRAVPTRGFTLIELITVISIMAVVVLCLVPLPLLMKRPPKHAAPVAAH